MKKRGFTLIELLAVIVILAVIALIVTPTILNVIEKARKSAFRDSILIARNQIEYYLMKNDLDEIPDDGVNVSYLNIKSDFKGGKFKKDENGKTIAYFIKNDSYCAYGPLDNLLIKKECNDLDITYPILDESKLSNRATTKTISIIILDGFAVDEESGIKKYEVKLYKGDKLIKSISKETVGTFDFSDLNENTTYNAEIIVTNGNDMESKINRTIITSVLNTPTYSIDKTGWATSKTVTIKYPSGYTNEYSLDDGVTWKTYTAAIKFTSPGTVIARVTDGKNTVTAASQTISQVDSTAPTKAEFSTTQTSKSITVVASGTDNESNISRYQFSSNNGSTWSKEQTSNTYTFNNLSTGTYQIKVRVINGTYVNNGINGNYKDSSSKAVATTTIQTPTYSITPKEYSKSKTLTITYPSGYTNEYSEDDGVTWKTYTGPITVTANKSYIARVSDGKNTVTAASFTVETIIDFTAKDIYYDNSKSGLESDNVQDAIVEIYNIIK